MSNFLWERCPEAETFIEEALSSLISKNSDLKDLEIRLLNDTSSRLFDWVDYIVVDEEDSRIESLGFTLSHVALDYKIYSHPGAQLPKIVLKKHSQGVAVSVESVEQYLLIRGKGGTIEGSPYSGLRHSLISEEEGVKFWVVERRSSNGIEPISEKPSYLCHFFTAREIWSRRLRNFIFEDEAIDLSLKAAEEMVELVGEAQAASIVLDLERDYWQAKNRAGQVQKARQDFLGMGWANHDHHTFRSSRKYFQALVKLFEILGFRCRERFYAGKEAGWGAQVMEHHTVRLVLFLDVDLLPEELELDFSHYELPEIENLGTIGLWCALHGDSILKGGMHHLEAQFMFDDLREDLSEQGVRMMAPFSDFPYLKQAFTEGEYWPVDSVRLEKLIKNGKISQEQKERFERKGAVGSHLENLQRREGYKGFNQKNVSVIIKQTDPRRV